MGSGEGRRVIHRRFQRRGPHGGTIRGDVRIPDGPAPRSAIIVVHGFKGFKDWAFFPHLSEALAGAGHAVITFNFSWNGIGEDPEEFTELDDFGHNTLSRELDELRWVVDRVHEGDLLEWRPRRVGLVGHSRGGGQAILATGEDPHIRALATWAAVANFDRWTEETREEWRSTGRVYVLNGRTGQQMPLDLTLLEDFEANQERLDVRAAASRVTAPWLVVHGADDLTVSSNDAEELVRLGAAARLHRIVGTGHTFGARHPFDGTSPQLADAVAATIRHMDATLGRG